MSGSDLAAKMLAFAMSQRGKPYSLSDTTGPNSYDCAGLVWAAAKHAGIDMPASDTVYPGSTLDFFGKYPGVSLVKNESQLRPGDIIFFGNTGAGSGEASVPASVDGGWSGQIGHVGIVLTKSTYVSAFGPPVDVRPFDSPFAVGIRLPGGAASAGSTSSSSSTSTGTVSSGPATTETSWWGAATGPDSPLYPISQAGNILKDITGTASSVGDVAVAIKGIAVSVGTLSHWLSWVFAPSNWVRIVAFVIGASLLLMGLIYLTKSAMVPING